MEVQRPVGEITRGTTNPNRLRRADRWLLAHHVGLLRGTPVTSANAADVPGARERRPALVVDLGYGASPITTLELAERLAAHPAIARARRGRGGAKTTLAGSATSSEGAVTDLPDTHHGPPSSAGSPTSSKKVSADQPDEHPRQAPRAGFPTRSPNVKPGQQRSGGTVLTPHAAPAWPVEVLGLEIDPERVRHAREFVATRSYWGEHNAGGVPGPGTGAGASAGVGTIGGRPLLPGEGASSAFGPAPDGPGAALLYHRAGSGGRPARVPVSFGMGGFEVPTPDGRPVAVIRAFNVLRQYDEAEVPAAWASMCGRLAPGGIVIDGTCNELGQRMTWITLDRDGPVSLTIAVAFGAIETPSDVAERLPKALIHHNVPGEPIHEFLTDWDDTWARNGHLSTFGRRQRFVASVRDLKDRGWPLLDTEKRWRQGEVTVAWTAVAPNRLAPS